MSGGARPISVRTDFSRPRSFPSARRPAQLRPPGHGREEAAGGPTTPPPNPVPRPRSARGTAGKRDPRGVWRRAAAHREAAVLRAAARSGRTRRVEAGPAELSLRRFAPAPAMADVEPLPPGLLGATAAAMGHAFSVRKNAKEAEPPAALPRGRRGGARGAPRGRRHVGSRGGPSGSDVITPPNVFLHSNRSRSSASSIPPPAPKVTIGSKNVV